MKNNSILLMAYGDANDHNKGMIQLVFDQTGQVEKTCLSVNGKANHAIVDGRHILIPVKEDDGPYLYFYEDMQLIQKVKVRYFYSHGVKGEDGCYYLASYEQGVDAIFDTASMQEVSFSIHQREGCTQQAKCHYIDRTPDHEYVYAIENGLQQIYVYQIVDRTFQIKEIIPFTEGENIRLMPFSCYSHHAYLNTELTNCLYTIAYEHGHFTIQDKLELRPSVAHSFSGGLAVSRDGHLLSVSVRMENRISCFSIAKDGSLTLLDTITCGNMPRDLQYFGDMLAVTCTLDNAVELYELQNQHLVKVASIPVAQPITFVKVEDIAGNLS